MGEALAGAGTALATAGGMKAVASGAARTAYNKGSDAVGGLNKMHGAAKEARSMAGSNASGMKKLKASMSAYGAVAKEDLKDKVKAHAEKFSKGHSSIPFVSAGLQKAGFTSGSGGSGGAGGSGGGASAHGMTGQGHDEKSLSTTSNPNYKSATKYDPKTQSQRSMTHKEFNAEKQSQGAQIYRDKMERENAKKAEQENKSDTSSELGENLSGNERAFDA